MAIRGTYWHVVSNQTSLIYFIFTSLILILKRADYIKTKELEGYEGIYTILPLLLASIGAFGAFTTTTWEADDKDFISVTMHLFGTTCAFIGTFAIIIEDNYSIISILFLIIAIIAFSMFVINGKFLDEMYQSMQIFIKSKIKIDNNNTIENNDNIVETNKDEIKNVQLSDEEKKWKEKKIAEVHNTSLKSIYCEAMAFLAAFGSVAYSLLTITTYRPRMTYYEANAYHLANDRS